MSIPRRFAPTKSRINHEFINQIIQEKSSTVDQNYGLMAQSVEAVLGQDLIREEDRAYLKDKVSSVLNTLDNTGSIKFDSKKTRFTIQDALSEAAKDPKILKQLAITKQIRQIGEFKETRSKKGDLDTTNFNDAWINSGINDYLRGADKNGNKVDDIGQFQYLEYRDVTKNTLAAVKDYKELFPDKKVPIRNGKGDIEEKTIATLSTAEWQQVIPSLISEQDRAQLAINGRVRFNYDDNRAINALNSEKESLTKVNSDKISVLKSNLLSGKDDVSKEEINNQIKLLEDENTKITNSYDNLLNNTGTAGSIGGYMLENQLVTGLANNLGFEPYTSDIKSDTSYWKALEELKKTTGETPDKFDTNKDGVTDATTVAIPTELDDFLSEKELYNNEIKLNESIVSTTVNRIYGRIGDEDTKKSVDDYKNELLRNGDDEATALRKTVIHFADAENPIMTLGEKETIIKALDKTTGIYKKMASAASKSENDIIEQDGGVLFQQLYNDNPNIKMIGYGGTFKNFMQKKGLNTKEKLTDFLTSDSKEARLFKANMKAQTTDFGINADSTYSDDFTGVTKYKLQSLRRIASLIGEDLSKTEVYTNEISPNGVNYTLKPLSEVKEGETIAFKGGYAHRTENLSKLESFLKEAALLKSKGITDHSMGDDGELSSLLSEKNYTEKYKRNLSTELANISGFNMINLQANTAIAKEVALLAGGSSNIEGKGIISLVKISPNEYQVLEQGYSTEYEEGSDKKGSKYRKMGVIRKSDIENMQDSNLLKFIDFKEQQTNIDLNIERELSSGEINYPKSTLKTEKSFAEYYGQNSPNALRASKNYVEKVIESNPALKGDFSNFAKKIVSNSNKFETKFESIDGYSMVSVYMRGIDDPIYQAKTRDPNIANDAYKVAIATPQVYLSKAIDDMAIRYQMGDLSKINEVEKFLK